MYSRLQKAQAKLGMMILAVSFTVIASMGYGADVPGSTSKADSAFFSLSPTPPMGWNSWNRFGCNISETLILEMADAMVKSGMQKAGYQYIIIDDCWQTGRDEQGNIITDKDKFPKGIKYLADEIHKKGLKLGIYSCAGSMTCQGRPGSRGHEFQDAKKYAEWGIDYLKYDWCYNEGQKAEAAYKTMSDAIKQTGKPIVFSICEWGENKPWEWGKGIGHLWRVTPDIRDCFECKFDWGGVGVLNIADAMAELYPFAGPGHWNDADMLEIGNGGMTDTEYATHFTLWSILATPLIAGNDLRSMSSNISAILTNKEVIDLNQDKLGQQARLFMNMGQHQIWAKPLANGEIAVCFLNRGETEWNLTYDWKKNPMYFATDVNIYKNEYSVKDLWEHKVLGTTAANMVKSIPGHGVLLVRLSPTGKGYGADAVSSVPANLNIDPFYKKYLDANGLPVVSSQNVSDEALVMAKKIIAGMLSKRKDVAQYMVKKGCKVMVIGASEQVCDLPEYKHICTTPDSIAFWNKRARGFGGGPEGDYSSSCGEENLICMPGDRYEGENILVHEFAHLIHQVGILGLDPSFNDKLNKLYANAQKKGLWKDTYAMTDIAEYFAEAVQSYFNCNRYSEKPNGIHNSNNRREKLKAYDPGMYNLIKEYFPAIDLPLCNKIHE